MKFLGELTGNFRNLICLKNYQLLQLLQFHALHVSCNVCNVGVSYGEAPQSDQIRFDYFLSGE